MALEKLWPFALVFLIFAILAGLGAIRGGHGPAPKYRKRKAFLSPAERSFFGVVKAAIGERYEILAKIRVADVLEPRSGEGRQAWQRAFNRIAMKHFDFVLCDPHTCQTIAAIELDDSSHRAAKAKERDAFLNEACHSAGFPLIRFPARRAYSHHDVATTISNAIGSDPTPRNPEQNVTDSTPTALPEQAAVAASGSSIPDCPKCGKRMLRRVAKKGQHKGTYFWGCVDYPSCRSVLKTQTVNETR